jgi:hypothetical protein
MAYTITKEVSVHGNMRVIIANVSADAASGSIPTGFSTIIGYNIAPISMNSGAPIIKVSTSSVVVSNATNGDNFFITIYGR